MKSISLLHLRTALLLAIVAIVPASHGEATDANTASIAFSRPDAPRTIRIEAMNSQVSVLGADVSDVTVRSSTDAVRKDTRRDDGLRVIAAANAFNLTERDNVVHLTQDSSSLFSGGGDFAVTVPRDTAVFVKVAINGNATVRDITGDIEISNLNGGVTLDNIGGGVAVDTMNGEISARYSALAEGKSHSFSSMNGKIVLRVPAAAKASFRLRAQNGTVATEFDEKTFITKSEAAAPGELPGMGGLRAGLEAAGVAVEMAHSIAREAMGGVRHTRYGTPQSPAEPESAGQPPAAPRPPAAPQQPSAPSAPRPPALPHVPTFPAFGGQVVTGTLNGGGVEIRATTMSGEIQIREAK
jgi:hypothetical protein